MERFGTVAGVTSVVEEEGVAALYAASYTRLVSVVGAVSGDRREAEEAVQDAFVRLLGRWQTVRTYDDPEAWVRKVALGKVSNSRRKRRNGWLALRRLSFDEYQPPPEPDALDIRSALAALPREQLAVVVLRQLGLRVPEIAAELRIPVGTVKSRLSRAQAILRPLLSDEVNDHV